MRWLATISGLVLLGSAGARMASAQVSLSVFLGTYSYFGGTASGTVDRGGAVPATVKETGTPVPVVSGIRLDHLGILGARTVGFEGTISLSSIRVLTAWGDSSFGSVSGRDANILTTSIKGMVVAGPAEANTRWHVSAGPALIWRTGDGFGGFSGRLKLGGNVGVGARFPLGKLRMRADLEDTFYSNRLTSGTTSAVHSFRNDVTLSLGMYLYDAPSRR